TAKQMQKAEQSKGLYIFIEALRESPLVLSTWDERLWITLIEKATIHFDGSITFTFKNGTEFEVKSER
ncbi:MAG: recombinase family protein, partial [Oscillospiraceae bacterium]